MEDPAPYEGIIEKLSEKSALTRTVFENTFGVFTRLKEFLHEMASELDETMEERGREVKIEYRDRGTYEAHLLLADDILIFNMHTNIFAFDRDHRIWENPYVGMRENSYCGMINIYNFLGDSFRYNRADDEGYLIGRIFVNRESHYFAEGKGQTSARHNQFGTQKMDRAALGKIVEAAIDYALGFDLLVPPYDSVKTATVEQLNTKAETKLQTGKRLGFEFNADDI